MRSRRRGASGPVECRASEVPAVRVSRHALCELRVLALWLGADERYRAACGASQRLGGTKTFGCCGCNDRQTYSDRLGCASTSKRREIVWLLVEVRSRRASCATRRWRRRGCEHVPTPPSQRRRARECAPAPPSHRRRAASAPTLSRRRLAPRNQPVTVPLADVVPALAEKGYDSALPAGNPLAASVDPCPPRHLRPPRLVGSVRKELCNGS